MACNSATMAWRASVRARALPSCRLTQRPSTLLRTQRYPGASRYASDSAAPAPAEAAKETVKDATKETAKEIPRKAGRGSKKALYSASLALTLLVGYIYGTDTRASIHRYGIVPLIRLLWPDAEDAHHIGVDNLKMLYQYGLHPRERGEPDRDGALATEPTTDEIRQVFGYTLSNPIGISAGLDKHADIPDALFDLGPAIVEVGGTTPLPQEGNPKPRVFRLPSQHAMINRYGLNSKGADHMAKVLKQRVADFAYAAGFGVHEESEQRVLDGEANVPPGSLVPGKLLAVQVAKNKLTPDGDIEAIKRDYVYCVDRVARYADILVVNPPLSLTAILTAVVASAKNVERKTKPYVMVKVSPDEDSNEQISGICEAVWNSGVDGVIVGNTTNRRPDPVPKGFKTLKETGGYSGPQLFDRSVALVARYRALLDQGPPSAADSDKSVEKVSELPRKVIFASGGITTGKEAREALKAGASVAMMYTGVVYGGVGTVTRVKQELREELQKK
ncbi:hypothetical protein N7519_010101 [Penicillium mononematosum]|uniref:uncharacterized protein n=1 Tax=Penicillium mononematosum TaxID=268346 RepID=UPI002548D99D|nr:uncharacterized protein N7519_010101 [Penicillium mononematosum]KAJ6179640.1 hypothetical protein N7519_010101 [Penicillium mononematosum]